jgi:Fe-S cluster biogenesis protein NfuA
MMSIEIEEKIERALDELRPYLQTDGGDIALIEVTEDYVAKLEFLGACRNCSMSMSTFKVGVEEAVKRAVPAIKSVEVINLTPMNFSS